jgi:predicted HicB family RNase H-like nuclease
MDRGAWARRADVRKLTACRKVRGMYRAPDGKSIVEPCEKARIFKASVWSRHEECLRSLDAAADQPYGVTMKNITVSVDDETYRRARMKAAERDTSVSALVRRFLTDLAAAESDREHLLRQERSWRARVTNFSASDRLSRDELYDRRR